MSLRSFFNGLKVLLIIPVFLLIGILSIAAYQIIQFLSYEPFDQNRIYFKDNNGNIYKDISKSCHDIICIFQPYKKMSVDKNTFSVLMVNNPFVNVDVPGGKIESNYAKDQNGIYYKAELISEADPASFNAVSYDLGKDKNQYYLYEKPLHKYITEKFNQSAISTPIVASELMEVLSYEPASYMVLKYDTHYFYLKLNQPINIEEISSDIAGQYPGLQ